MGHDSLRNEELCDLYREEIGKIVDGVTSEIVSGDLLKPFDAFRRLYECVEASEWVSEENNESLAIQVLLCSTKSNQTLLLQAYPNVFSRRADYPTCLSDRNVTASQPFIFEWFARQAMYYEALDVLQGDKIFKLFNKKE